MELIKICVVLTAVVLHCNGLGIYEQLAHITNQKAQSRDGSPRIMRRFSSSVDPSVILGAPLYPHHLPQAEPILPGHTLIRPAVGMLKSAVKFPHREQENGAGVYGHINNLGIKYDGKNERVMYSGFRRSLPGLLPGLIPGFLSELIPVRKSKNRKSKKIKPNRKSPYQDLEYRTKKRPNKDNRYLKKTLTIFPAKPIPIANKENTIHHKKIKFKIKTHALRKEEAPQNYETNSYLFIILRHRDKQERGEKIEQKRDGALEKASATEGTDWKDFLHIIKSLRRDQELHQVQERPKKYVPGNFGLGSFVMTQRDSDEGEINKTSLFWDTQNAFNHIKVNPDAPEHSDLLPTDASNNVRNWWFYHHADFEEFEDR